MLYFHMCRAVTKNICTFLIPPSALYEREEILRIAPWLKNHDSEDVISHPNTKSKGRIRERDIFLFPSPHVHSHSSICRNRKMSAQRFPISPVCCLLLRLMTKHRTAAGSTGGQPSYVPPHSSFSFIPQSLLRGQMRIWFFLCTGQSRTRWIGSGMENQVPAALLGKWMRELPEHKQPEI